MPLTPHPQLHGRGLPDFFKGVTGVLHCRLWIICISGRIITWQVWEFMPLELASSLSGELYCSMAQKIPQRGPYWVYLGIEMVKYYGIKHFYSLTQVTFINLFLSRMISTQPKVAWFMGINLGIHDTSESVTQMWIVNSYPLQTWDVILMIPP